VGASTGRSAREEREQAGVSTHEEHEERRVAGFPQYNRREMSGEYRRRARSGGWQTLRSTTAER